MRARYAADLVGQMALCDTNYYRLMQLMPAMASEDERSFAVSLVGGRSARCRIRVLERCKYTTMLDLRLLQPAASWPRPPHFQLRVYHDAQSAEVTSYQGLAHFRGVYDYPNRRMLQRDEKHQLNRLLAEWLSYCLRHGYADHSAGGELCDSPDVIS